MVNLMSLRDTIVDYVTDKLPNYFPDIVAFIFVTTLYLLIIYLAISVYNNRKKTDFSNYKKTKARVIPMVNSRYDHRYCVMFIDYMGNEVYGIDALKYHTPLLRNFPLPIRDSYEEIYYWPNDETYIKYVNCDKPPYLIHFCNERYYAYYYYHKKIFTTALLCSGTLLWVSWMCSILSEFL